MKVGILLPQTGKLATSENVLYIGKEAEKEGLDSVWVFERLLWPLKPQTSYFGAPIPLEYQNVLDPLETLTYLAGNIERISLGTSIIDMLFHNPCYTGEKIRYARCLIGWSGYCRSRNWMVKR